MFKVFKRVSPVIFAEDFSLRQQNQCNRKNYPYFAMPCVQTVSHGLESLPYLGSKFCTVYHLIWKKETLLMNLNMLPKLVNLIFALADFSTIIYKILDVYSFQKTTTTNRKHMCLENLEYHNRFSHLPYVTHLLFLV